MEDIEKLADDILPNLGALFAEHLQAQDEAVPVTGKEEGDGRESIYTDLQTLRGTAR